MLARFTDWVGVGIQLQKPSLLRRCIFSSTLKYSIGGLHFTSVAFIKAALMLGHSWTFTFQFPLIGVLTRLQKSYFLHLFYIHH